MNRCYLICEHVLRKRWENHFPDEQSVAQHNDGFHCAKQYTKKKDIGQILHWWQKHNFHEEWKKKSVQPQVTSYLLTILASIYINIALFQFTVIAIKIQTKTPKLYCLSGKKIRQIQWVSTHNFLAYIFDLKEFLFCREFQHFHSKEYNQYFDHFTTV